MMGSIGFGEIMIIAIVALIIFGPHRLPEIARKAGELLTKARAATKEFTDSLDIESAGGNPLKDLQNEYEATKQQLRETATSLADLATPTQGDGDQPTPEAPTSAEVQPTDPESVDDEDGASE